MADWLDYVRGAQQAGIIGRTQAQPRPQPRFGLTTASGQYSPWEISRPSASGFNRAMEVAVTRGRTAKAGPPERFDIGMPFTAPRPAIAPPPRPSTTGDPIGSVGSAIGDTYGQLTLGNFIPWFMERSNVLASELADANLGPLDPFAEGARVATDGFVNGVKAIAEVTAPILEALPNWYRDSQLGDRAKFYRSIVQGEGSGRSIVTNPFGALTTTGTVIPGTYAVSENARNYDLWREVLRRSVDPGRRMEAEREIAILRDAVDLPESVKAAIRQRPNLSDDDIEQLLNEAPEGRAWSYAGGVPGLLGNIGYPVLFFAAEAKAGLGLARGARGALVGGRVSTGLRAPTFGAVPTATSRAVPGLAGELGGSAAGAITRGVAGAQRVISTAAQLQKWAMISGVSTAALTTAYGAVAKYNGDQAAIEWFDRVNRTQPMSDDPRVQLVTGFTVNPLSALGYAKRGIITLAKGAGEVVVGRTLGRKFAKLHDSDELLYGSLARFYRLGGAEEAKAFAHGANEYGVPFYENKGEVFDEVVGLAADDVLNGLPQEERLAFIAANHSPADPLELTRAVLRQYGEQTWEAVTRRPNEIARRWNVNAWEYHGYPGAFNPWVAGMNARDFRMGKAKTYDLRQNLDAVLGYTEYLRPQAAVLAREFLDRVTAADGTVATEGPSGFQDLVRQFPALRNYWQGVIAGEQRVPRATIETILERAEQDYARVAKQNPARARTGADPVIRPDSPTYERDLADALGTDTDTMKAITNGDESKTDLVRSFLASKLDDPTVVTTAPEDQVWQQAFEYMQRVAGPWIRQGEIVAAAERQLQSARSRLRELYAIGEKRRSMLHDEEITRVERQMNDLLRLIRTASDPIVPFAEDVRLDRVAARWADRVRRVKNPDRLTRSERRMLEQYTFRFNETGVGLSDRALYERAIVYAERAPRVTGVDAHLAELAERKVEAIAKLDELSALDSSADMLGFSGGVSPISGTHWSTFLRRTPAGMWGWTGGLPPMSVGLRATVARWLRRNGRPGEADTMLEFGDEEAWQVFNRFPRAIEGLTATQRRYVARVRSSYRDISRSTLDEHANAAGLSADEFMERLGRAADEREAILDAPAGSLRERNLRRTAAMVVPNAYVTEAAGNLDAQSLIYDAEFEAVIHPGNIAQLRAALENAAERYSAVRGIVMGDPVLVNQASQIARSKGVSLHEMLSDPTYAPALKSLIPDGFEVPPPGPQIETPLDELVMSGDDAAISQKSRDLAAVAEQGRDPIRTTLRTARQVLADQPTTRKPGKQRPSSAWRLKFVSIGADLTAPLDDAIMSAPENRIGMDVLSILNHGIAGTRPATVRGLIAVLRTIESGQGAKLGFGPSLLAEGQRVANKLLNEAHLAAKRKGFEPGVYTRGIDPAMMAEEDLELARALGGLDQRGNPLREGGQPLLVWDDADPLGTLQYGLKTRPKAAVVTEFAQVPGLTEEFLEGRFVPWQERTTTAWIRQAYNYLFGRYSNAELGAVVRENFVERAVLRGVDQKVATAVWERWRKISKDSRDTEVRIEPTGARRHIPADNPLYADVRNIPNKLLDRVAHEVLDEMDLPMAYRTRLSAIDYSQLFREASSPIRRWLKGETTRIGRYDIKSPVPRSIGDLLAGMYGGVVHNKGVTTLYYWFRFALDIRYHAMNYFEAQILYAGRAGLRNGEINEGMLGQTEGYLRNLDVDYADNTGYATSRARFAYAYRTFLKEQPDMLRGKLKGLRTENPELMEQAIREMGASEPGLRDMIATVGDGDMDGYLRAVDSWYSKMLRTVSDEDAAAAIDDAFAAEIKRTPHLAEVYSVLAQANKDLWVNIRQTFYGNPNRSRVERWLNSYLLFWPVSYQIKATKWLLNTMFSRAGGLPTNAGGAVVMDRIAQTHQQLLATDPEYRDWFEKHDTLLFIAQMLVPITPTSMGVSLNPALRSMFFERTKAVWEIGPIYTLTELLPNAARELYVDMYPTLKDVPVVGGLYRAATGEREPQPRAFTSE